MLLEGSAATAGKFRKYLLVRTQMSIVTGVLVGLFAAVTGLPFAFEWGVIAFVLNYIPFIGPFIATLFPTLLAMTQFQSWPAVLGTFACLNIIQFVVGSYIEPRVAGATVSISPFVVLFAIFLGPSCGVCSAPSSACRSRLRSSRSAPSTPRRDGSPNFWAGRPSP